MTEKIRFVAFLILYMTKTVRGQCITANDTIVNETIIDRASRSLIDGSTEFGLILLRILNDDQKNDKEATGLFLNSHLIWSALVVAYMGSKGATEQEMKNVLGIGDFDKETAWEAFKNIHSWKTGYDLEWLKEHPRSYYLSANRIYFENNTFFNYCFREMLDSEIAFLDFKNKPFESRDEINRWVEKETQHHIKDLIPVAGISELTKMVAVNAAYFTEHWRQPFLKQRTVRRRFTAPMRKDIIVNMMNIRNRFLYGKNEELQCYALEIPYAGNAFMMTILLPKNRYNGVNILTRMLTPERLRSLFLDLYPREVDVSIPKFKVEDSFELSSVLSKMGLRTLFDTRRVDLSGFTGQREFSFDAVHHKAFIDVKEDRTEAASITPMITSRIAKPIVVASFVADYPFVFFIRDTLYNVILFSGVVKKPPEYK